MEEYNKRRENYVWVTVIQYSWPSKQRNRQPNLKHVDKHQRETRTSKAKLKTSSVSQRLYRSTVCGPEAGISAPRTEDVSTPSWPSWWAGSLSQREDHRLKLSAGRCLSPSFHPGVGSLDVWATHTEESGSQAGESLKAWLPHHSFQIHCFLKAKSWSINVGRVHLILLFCLIILTISDFHFLFYSMYIILVKLHNIYSEPAVFYSSSQQEPHLSEPSQQLTVLYDNKAGKADGMANVLSTKHCDLCSQKAPTQPKLMTSWQLCSLSEICLLPSQLSHKRAH